MAALSARLDDRPPARAPALSVRLETGPAALALLDERWDGLLERTSLPNPLLSTTWLRALTRWHTGEPLVAVADMGGTVVAGAALEVSRRGGRLGPRVATWLGPPELMCSADLLVDPDRPQAGEAVLAAVLEEVDSLSVGAPASGGAARALATVAPWRSAAVYNARWLLPWPPPRLEYVRQRTAGDRRRAERLGATIEVRVASSPEELGPALARLYRVHRDRWRDRPDAQARLATTRFHRHWNTAVLTELAAAGSVRLVEVVEDGRTVGACLGLLHGTGGLAHTLAVRPGGHLREPGLLAALVRAEALAAAGAQTVDLGHGAAEPGSPKARLGPTPDPLAMLFAARSPARQRLYDAPRRARQAAAAISTGRAPG